jgi:hypothetical protein
VSLSRPKHADCCVVSEDAHFEALVRALLSEADLSVWSTDVRQAADITPVLEASLVLLDLTARRQAVCWQLLDALDAAPRAPARRVVVCAASQWLLEGHASAFERADAVWAEPFDPQALLEACQSRPLT